MVFDIAVRILTKRISMTGFFKVGRMLQSVLKKRISFNKTHLKLLYFEYEPEILVLLFFEQKKFSSLC